MLFLCYLKQSKITYLLFLYDTNSTYLTEFIENQGWVSRKFHLFSTDKREHTAAICHMCQKLSFLHVSTIHTYIAMDRVMYVLYDFHIRIERQF